MLPQKRVLKTLFHIWSEQKAATRGERKAPLSRPELIKFYKKQYGRGRATADRDVNALEEFGLIRLVWSKLPDDSKREVYVVNRESFKEEPSLTFATKEEKLSILYPSKRYTKKKWGPLTF